MTQPGGDLLSRAIEIAVRAHAGQTDKGGQPYILHPLRVMLAVEGEAARIVAVLHDVVEDSDWTLEALAAEGFGPPVLEALACLTRRPDETYEAFIGRVAPNPLARTVKLADMTDNANIARIPAPTERDHARAAKYRRHIAALSQA